MINKKQIVKEINNLIKKDHKAPLDAVINVLVRRLIYLEKKIVALEKKIPNELTIQIDKTFMNKTLGLKMFGGTEVKKIRWKKNDTWRGDWGEDKGNCSGVIEKCIEHGACQKSCVNPCIDIEEI